MNGAESLVRTLVNGGVDVCFSNPGTSEMHFVAALDRVKGIRCVLGLFEGVVTGAADGYARMAEKPAVTLLHLGPGLGNGLANLHNAKKAGSPVINIVGEHALWHIEHDAPLTADIEGIASPVSHWVKTAESSTSLAADCSAAIKAANGSKGQIATLILPANTAWDDATEAAIVTSAAPPAQVSGQQIQDVARKLRNGKPTAILLGGDCLRESTLCKASQIAQKTGAVLLSETSNARSERGVGRVPIKSIPYPVDQALSALASYEQIVTVCAKAPVAFFAYPDKPSCLWSKDTEIISLAAAADDGANALEVLVDELDAASIAPELQSAIAIETPSDGALTSESVNHLIAKELPDQAIVIDEAITSGRNAQSIFAGSAQHDWLQIVGGAIGIGFPLAAGAAVACPDRKVVALQADGSGMYTLQALWTQAREGLDITTIVYSNRSYAILQGELANVRAESGPIANDMMTLDRPDLDWVSLARGMGVEAVRATTVAEFHRALLAGLSTSTPFLIEAVI